MAVLQFILFFMIAFTGSLYFRRGLPETIPVVFCLMGILLYPLAVIGHLEWIHGIGIGMAFLCAAFILCRRKLFSKELLSEILLDPYFLAFLLILAALSLAVSFRQVLEWDAYNFWAADVKSLFFRNGFAPKYLNVAPAFGDYPPCVQLLLWWFVSPLKEWNEGVVFSGYILFGASLLFFFAYRLRLNFPGWKGFFCGILFGILVLLLPSVVDTAWYRSLYMDPIMAFLFGNLLCLCLNEQEKESPFHRISFLSFLVFLVLTKSIGILWAAFALLFFIVWLPKTRKRMLFAGGSALLCGAVYFSWRLYCIVLERRTTLVADMSSSFSDRWEELLHGVFLQSGNNPGYLRSFFTAFLKESVHRYSSVNIDLTPAFIAVLVFGVVWLLYRQRSVTLTEGKKLIGYELLIFLITYSMLLFAHLTMFYHETAYLESSKMIEQMTRYSSPANLGLLMLSIALLLRHGKEKGFPKKASMAAICVLIVCCSGWGVVVDGFIPGHDRLDPQRQQLREDIFNEYKPFIEAVGSISADDPCGRILLCEEGEGFGSKLPIIGYLVSPRSMMGVELNDGLSGKDVLLLAKNGHCGYLYITEGSDLQKKELTAALGLDREFQWGRLYHITDPLK